MSKIVRTKTRAEGGITPDEKVRMDAIAKEWTGIAFRSEPIEADKIIQAIEGLYRDARKAPAFRPGRMSISPFTQRFNQMPFGAERPRRKSWN